MTPIIKKPTDQVMELLQDDNTTSQEIDLKEYEII